MTVTATPAPSRQLGWHLTGILGELMVTLGVLVLAFVGWQLWWTDVVGNRAQADIVTNLHWAPVPTPAAAAPVVVDKRHDASPPIAEPGHEVTFATLLVPDFIMSESFLSFLGLGVSAPLASWGSLVSEGTNTMELYPWQLLVPAFAMTFFLFAMNFLGDGLRDALDPQSKNRL